MVDEEGGAPDSARLAALATLRAQREPDVGLFPALSAELCVLQPLLSAHVHALASRLASNRATNPSRQFCGLNRCFGCEF